MYENKTQESILASLLSLVNPSVSVDEGTLTEKALSPVSIELALAYAELERVLKLGFAPTSVNEADEYLDYRASEHGVYRKQATKAKTDAVVFNGTDGAIINAGTIIETNIGTQFKTLTEKTITGGTATVSVEALEAGTAGNVPANQINRIVTPIIGVAGVTNSTATAGGADKETNSELLERLLFEVRNKGTSGNKAHYKQWALEVADVGDAKVFEKANGNGTVKVVIINRDKQPASNDLVTQVFDYIEENRPVCVGVEVVSATAKPITVTASMTLASGYTLEQVGTMFEANLLSYLKSIAFKINYVSYGQVGNVLIDTEGVVDYAELTVNGSTANVLLTDVEVATLGTVTLT